MSLALASIEPVTPALVLLPRLDEEGLVLEEESPSPPSSFALGASCICPVVRGVPCTCGAVLE